MEHESPNGTKSEALKPQPKFIVSMREDHLLTYVLK